MRAETYYLTSLKVIDNCMTRISKIMPEEKLQVTISNIGTKSARQRGLQWMGYDDVVMSGIGDRHCDTKENVHLAAKYRFAIPIFIRDDPFFSDLYAMWCNKYEYAEDKEQRILHFVDKYVSTEKFNVSQMAEFLTEFRNDCMKKGIQLRDPEFDGLLND